MQGHRPGRASSLALAEAPRIFLCRLFPYSVGPYARPGEYPGLGSGKENVHLVDIFALHCHKLGWALRLVLAEADIVFTCRFF